MLLYYYSKGKQKSVWKDEALIEKAMLKSMLNVVLQKFVW